MKINYIDHVQIVKAINSDLDETSGDLALELYELEVDLVKAFTAHTKQAAKLQRELTLLKKKGEALSQGEQSRLIQIDKEANEIYKKTKEIECEKFPFGDGSERDLKPYLTLKGIRAFKPLLEIKKP